jgi:hypothetical protein
MAQEQRKKPDAQKHPFAVVEIIETHTFHTSKTSGLVQSLIQCRNRLDGTVGDPFLSLRIDIGKRRFYVDPDVALELERCLLDASPALLLRKEEMEQAALVPKKRRRASREEIEKLGNEWAEDVAQQSGQGFEFQQRRTETKSTGKTARTKEKAKQKAKQKAASG